MPDTPVTQTPEQIAQAVADAAKPKELEVKLSTGQVFKGATPEEVISKIASAQEQASTTIRDREEQIRQLNEQLAQRQATQAQPISADGTFDKKKYWELMDQNPVEAQNYLDSVRLQIPQEQVVPAYQYAYTVSQRVADQMEVARFHQTFPDFPGGDQNADLLLRECEARGRATNNADMLGVTFMELQREGKITPSASANTTATQQRETPPPMLGGGGGQDVITDANIEQKMWQMTDEQLEQLAVKLGAKK